VGGHGTAMGGALVDLGTFQWKGNPRFADFNQPDDSYHGIVYADVPALCHQGPGAGPAGRGRLHEPL
jgi:O-acetylhomoserine/O-acetylserine sulfhydrylase-like pyridoxal-dependent enzyme